MSGFDHWIFLHQTLTGRRNEIPTSAEVADLQRAAVDYELSRQRRRWEQEEYERTHPSEVEEWNNAEPKPDMLKLRDGEVDEDAWTDEAFDAYANDRGHHHVA